MSAHLPQDFETPPSPYEGRRLSVGNHLAISSLWFAMALHWAALLIILAPYEIGKIAPAAKAQTLGLVTGATSIIALIMPIIVGAYSDRCASRFGRRRPYIVWGMGINLIGLAIMYLGGQALSLWLYAGGLVVVQFGNNLAAGAYAGFIPDLVPEDQRGIASGYYGALNQFGSVLGLIGVGYLLSFTGNPLYCYLLIGGSMLVCTLATWFGVKENPLSCKPQPISLLQIIRGSWVNPRLYPDFAWVWITRAFVTFGQYSVQPFLQYYMADVIGSKNAVMHTGLTLGVLLLVATVTGLIGGHISDRIGRKRVVYVANAIIAFAVIGFIFVRDLPMVIVLAGIMGIGYGAYYSVDWALGVDVLPSRQEGARYLGIWHVAMVFPQSIAQPLSGAVLAFYGATPVLQGGETTYQYTQAGYTTIFVVAAFFFILGAVLLKNVKGAR